MGKTVRDLGFPNIALAAGWNAVEARDWLLNPLFGKGCLGLKFGAPKADSGLECRLRGGRSTS